MEKYRVKFRELQYSLHAMRVSIIINKNNIFINSSFKSCHNVVDIQFGVSSNIFLLKHNTASLLGATVDWINIWFYFSLDILQTCVALKVETRLIVE